MKSPVIKALVLGGAGIVLGSFTSCVAPYSVSAGPTGNGTIYSAGYQTRSLPTGYRTEVIDNTSYYSHNGTYYRPRSGGYVVVEAPSRRGPRDGYYRDDRRDGRRDDSRDDHRGHGHQQAELRRLPSGYRTVTHGGTRYYQSGDVYYQQRGETYVVVSSPF